MLSWALLALLLLACAHADDLQQVQQDLKGGFDADLQQVQQAYGVKGGFGRHENYANFFGNQTQVGHNMRHNLTAPAHLDVGVCFIEVPTASLVRDPKHIPAGNGSRPELSRIRSCCKGYIRNIHNYYKCDPVCSTECVNALCTSPEVCTCFPDHVKNVAGFCIPTCPIGCQNGHCAGGECLCKEGFKLHVDGRFCVPNCRGNCGGIGNCTAPNVCECKPGYESTPTGSCQPACDKCTNGDCVAPGDCRCHKGYAKDQRGVCILSCGVGFQPSAEGCKPVCDRCSNGDCVSPNECHCKPGYTKDQQGLCVPHCTPDCGLSSRCIAPNVCDPPIPVKPNTYQPLPGYPYPQTNQQNPNQPNQYNPYRQPTDNHNQQPNQLYPNIPNQQFVSANQPAYPVYPESQFQGSSNGQGGSCTAGQTCLNGACDNGRCTCNPGYLIDGSDASGTRCIPDCPGGCPNGICSAPHFCICNAGYYKDHSVKGRSTCVKRAKRSAEAKPINVAELLVFEIPDELIESENN